MTGSYVKLPRYTLGSTAIRSQLLMWRNIQVTAKFHYTGTTGPDQTKSADFVGDPGLAKKSVRVRRSDPCSGI